VLYGRDAECAALASLIAEARAGRGGALVLRGQPGVGKSALLAHAADTADVQVLRVRGVESESPLAFAALQRLLRPVLHHLGRLPAPQARALLAAFGAADTGPDTDRFRIFLAALSLLAEAAEHAPVLALVDDAQWLDDVSAAALLFVARRLGDERIALLFAARDGDVRRFDADLPELTLSGLDAAAAADLLVARTGATVSPEVSAHLVARTGGNPLALVELPDVLAPSALAGDAPLPPELPVTAGVERAFLDRARRLPAAAQTLLLVAAADDSGHAATVRRAAAALGAGDDALDAAERSGLLAVREAELELRHPLVRSAVYQAATSLERRRAHLALADALPGTHDADRRAWHRAAAADGPDEEIARQLAEAAGRARSRGGQEAASAALERAAELTPVPGDVRARRRYGAAEAAWLAGRPVPARALADAALLDVDDPVLRADIVRLRARVEWNTGSIQLGHRMLLHAARDVAPHDPERAREMAAIAAGIATVGGDSGVDVDPSALVPPATEGDPPHVRCTDAVLHGLAAVRRGDWGDAAARLRPAFATDPRDTLPVDLLANLGVAALHLGDDEAVDRLHTALLVRARDAGATIVVLYTLTRRAFASVTTGRWSAAEADAAEALQLARATARPALAGLPLAWLALLAARRGDPGADEHLRAAEDVLADHPGGTLEPLTRDVVAWTKNTPAQLGRLHLWLVRGPAALDRLSTGDRSTTAAAVAELEAFATATGTAWAAAAAEHGRALLAGDRDAEAHFAAALAHHARSPRRIDRARTELAFGEHLRRARRRVDARGHLRAALEVFEDVGAAPWAERARQELRASGETARRRDDSPVTALTPQELQVARLVADGLPNREVAARLFVSPRTVEFHLRNVFAKAGVTSRAELTRLPLS
jgi:DNA-binding CsgD family transcriptional regulator